MATAKARNKGEVSFINLEEAPLMAEYTYSMEYAAGLRRCRSATSSRDKPVCHLEKARFSFGSENGRWTYSVMKQSAIIVSN